MVVWEGCIKGGERRMIEGGVGRGRERGRGEGEKGNCLYAVRCGEGQEGGRVLGEGNSLLPWHLTLILSVLSLLTIKLRNIYRKKKLMLHFHIELPGPKHITFPAVHLLLLSPLVSHPLLPPPPLSPVPPVQPPSRSQNVWDNRVHRIQTPV